MHSSTGQDGPWWSSEEISFHSLANGEHPQTGTREKPYILQNGNLSLNICSETHGIVDSANSLTWSFCREVMAGMLFPQFFWLMADMCRSPFWRLRVGSGLAPGMTMSNLDFWQKQINQRQLMCKCIVLYNKSECASRTYEGTMTEVNVREINASQLSKSGHIKCYL